MNKINFGKIVSPIGPPLLLKMQKDSFAGFLQQEVVPEKRKFQGLEGVFRDIFPLTNFNKSLVLEYVSYSFGEAEYSIEECIARDVTYALPLKVKLRFIRKKDDGKEKELSEQEVYFGDIPLMTDTATFIINGAERVVVSQIHRSPGVVFEEDEAKRVSVLGKPLCLAKMIPYRGAWIEFEFDQSSILYVRIDRKRKVYVTTFLRALGFESGEMILNLFKDVKKLSLDMASRSLTSEYLAEDLCDKVTGEVIADSGDELKEELIKKLQARGFSVVYVLKDISILLTLKKDTIKTQKEAINYIYRTLKAQEFITQERAQEFLEDLLFKSVRRYDLTAVGRYKILKKLSPIFKFYEKNFKLATPSEGKRTLTREDVVATLKYLLMLYNGETEFFEGGNTTKINLDDIDHLGNRRVKSVGELLENEVRIGLVQMARIVKEHMNNQSEDSFTPRSLVNITQFSTRIKKFFGTSQLSQFMDQINPLSELTNKRRLSALGPGGLNRKRAGFEIRDVHHTHYGRICPIETPEGPNIGLITSLAIFARINSYGIIETPYRKVEAGRATDKIEYLTADQEDEFFVAQANTPLDGKGKITTDSVQGRKWEDFLFQAPAKVDFMDVSPMQVISVSAALIPFLEHDDANRALMGCNMQRQGVPLLLAEPPLVSTGIEEKVAKDSGVVVVAKSDGEVVSVSSNEIVVYTKSGREIETYNLRKYARSNQDTCINQIPLVALGDVVKKNQIIADGPATRGGQLALGQNLLVAYMTWDGYNFEDAILLSEKLIQDDKFTSVHIREFQIEARETKGRPEEITKDIPDVGSEDLLALDDDGVIRVGSYVQRGDILVGKTIPKVEQQITPEEKLLKVLFGKKAEDVQDASLRVPPGIFGKVIAVRAFIRLEKLDEKKRRKKLEEMREVYETAKAKLRMDKKEQLISVKKSDVSKIELLYASKENILKNNYELDKKRFNKGDYLPVSVNKVVKVYIATKLKIQVGDKLAGRHGNKGVVAKILPVEDMPRLPDGTPVDCVLSPLAIPSRMNVGQLLEVMLGWAGKELGFQMVTPVFDSASEEQIREYVKKAKAKILDEKKKSLIARGLRGEKLKLSINKFAHESLPTDDCRVTLYDGRTGEPFMEKVTVGVMYVMKLNHLVEDKMHARSTGPYSLVTRQPLGGRSHFGGQRFGEMEVWAVEGYGAAHVLQEFLTIKSDDVDGRIKIYDSIIRGEHISGFGIPESFKVLVNEIRALSLNVEFLNSDNVPLKRRMLTNTRTTTSFQNQKKKPNSLNFASFDAIRLSVASPEQIKTWSFGEVKKPETINYRTFKPERDGLFCDRIFGPTKDWECCCGKFKYIKHKGTICDRCGVEVTESKVRRERFGHIELAVPVAHLWFLKKPPSRIGILLNMKISDIEKVVYYTKYVVMNNLKDSTGVFSIFEKGMLLKEEELNLFRHGFNNPVAREEYKAVCDGVIAEEISLDSNQAKAVKQLKLLVKFQSDFAGISSNEVAERILANIEKGNTYYRVYFKPHAVYFYADLDSPEHSKLKIILSDKFGKEDSVSIVESHKEIRIEFFDIEKDKVFNALRKEPETLKKYEGHLRIEVFKNEIPFAKYFSKPDCSVLLEECDVKKFREGFGNDLKVDIGASAIRELLSEINLREDVKEIYAEIKKVKLDAGRARLIKKLRIVEGFLNSGTRPEWMILTTLPVIPPDLRPLVALDGGRFAASDLNDLYRRIINRNNRLRHIEQLRAPTVMINNEKRLLQEAVDALIDGDSKTSTIMSTGARVLKSLSETLKGKQGRFRQNLLGKRVDYSGRSVIVVGPDLKLGQCGLPKEMALELFKPFIIKGLMLQENVTFKSARRMFERVDSKVWNILENVIKNHPVLLNRAPTLHRLGIQAFEPVLIEGKSIQLHPLTCAAFNADFDGDQMSVHLPISLESQLEAKILMMATRNMLSPASGKPIIVPSQDMVLGSFYLTKEKIGVPGEGKIFYSTEEVISAYQNKKVDLQARIKVMGITNIRDEKLKNEEQSDVSKWKNYKSEDGSDVINYTTVGRTIFNERLPKNDDGYYSLGYQNKAMTKEELGVLVGRCYKELGEFKTVILLDEIKKMGYKYATLAGISISVEEMKIPIKKEKMVNEAKLKVKEIEKQAKLGLITEYERYNKIIDIWTRVTDEISDIMFDEMRKREIEVYQPNSDRFNSIFIMADSGARGSRQQVRQLAGMRGLMAKPQKKLTGSVGEIIETPIVSSFREGLTVLEYFISTHGGRKGLADTALKTAEAGYLTRRLVDVAHDVVVRKKDCGTLNGVFVGTLRSGDEIVEKMDERVIGRIALGNIVDIVRDEVIIKKGEMITVEKTRKLVDAGIDKIGIRSVLTCESDHGVCAKCYGMNPATGSLVEVGEAVGILAAQSIGEPGTQLTLRTFHIGGTASRVVSRSEIYAENSGTANYYNLRSIQNRDGEIVVVSRNAELVYTEESTYKKQVYKIPYGAVIKVQDGKKVEVGVDSTAGIKKNVLMVKWDPHSKPIFAESGGTIQFVDIKEGVTLHREKSKITGQIERVIIESLSEKKTPKIIIKKGNRPIAEYPLPAGTTIIARDGCGVKTGDILAKISQEISKSRDITGGLPRVTELFEGRKSRNSAIISEIDGIVHFGGETAKSGMKIEVENTKTKIKRNYFVSSGSNLLVYEGDRIKEGEAISDGVLNPHDILRVKGHKEVQEYLVNEIQQIYRLQGVVINDKHIEIIAKQMLSNVRIVDSGDSHYLDGEIISKRRYEADREAIKVNNGKPPVAYPILLGITKASLSSDSFVSAASFQETTRILTEAAVSCQVDHLVGLKENVSLGRLIPAGTGLVLAMEKQ